jgi:hypothetical protein
MGWVKKEARLLKEKAVSSLLLSIDHFNRISELGRVDATLIVLEHSFEMLPPPLLAAPGVAPYISGYIRSPGDGRLVTAANDGPHHCQCHEP